MAFVFLVVGLFFVSCVRFWIPYGVLAIYPCFVATFGMEFLHLSRGLIPDLSRCKVTTAEKAADTPCPSVSVLCAIQLVFCRGFSCNIK